MKPNMTRGLLSRRAWGIFGISALLLCSCDSKSLLPKPSEASREYWISNFEAMLKSNSYSDSHAQSVRDLLKELRQSPDPVKPRLIYADWSYDGRQKAYINAIDYYDETRTVVGFRLREYDSGHTLILTEDYPVYPHPIEAYMGNIHIPFSPRSNNEKKDENAWANYVKSGKISRDLLPTVWLSIPTNERSVEISLISNDGKESASLRLRQEKSQESPSSAPAKTRTKAGLN